MSTPIPLRDTGFGDLPDSQPNPWTRLRAVDTSVSRLGSVVATMQTMAAGADRAATIAVLTELYDDLKLALWGNLGDVERVAGRLRGPHLVDQLLAVLWPSWGSSSADLDQADERPS